MSIRTLQKFSVGDSGGMAYASVLGTDSERIVSSSLTCRTNLKSCVLKGVKCVCNSVCVFASLVQTVGKKLAEVPSNLLNARLRNFCQKTIYSLQHIILVNTRFFLNNPSIRYSISLANKRKQTDANTIVPHRKTGEMF